MVVLFGCFWWYFLCVGAHKKEKAAKKKVEDENDRERSRERDRDGEKEEVSSTSSHPSSTGGVSQISQLSSSVNGVASPDSPLHFGLSTTMQSSTYSPNDRFMNRQVNHWQSQSQSSPKSTSNGITPSINGMPIIQNINENINVNKGTRQTAPPPLPPSQPSFSTLINNY